MSLSSIDTSFTFASVETTGYDDAADVATSLFDTTPQVPPRNVHFLPFEDLMDTGSDDTEIPDDETSEGRSVPKSVSIFLGIDADWFALKTPRRPILF